MIEMNDGSEPDDTNKMFGEELIWLFILGDMATFAMFFWIYGHARSDELELFQASQSNLSVHYGSINTMILLISSWLVVLAVKSARQTAHRVTQRYLIAAAGFGCLFAILKAVEYQQKFAAGFTFETDNFFMFYYLLTGLHYAHLLTGIGVLLYFAYVFRAPSINAVQFRTFESGAIFWHMVDLLWIIIFPLLYLLP
jgi:nitric oxide reductase NorE protein